MPTAKDRTHVVAIVIAAPSVTPMSDELLKKLELIVEQATKRGMTLTWFVYFVPCLYW